MSKFILIESHELYWVCEKIKGDKFRPWHPNGISKEAAKRLRDDLVGNSCLIDTFEKGDAPHSASSVAEFYYSAAQIYKVLGALKESSDSPLDDFAIALHLAQNPPWVSSRTRKCFPEPELPF